MDAVVGSALLACLTGLTWVAYKHPRGYRKIYMAILVALFLITIAAATWNLATLTMYKALYPLIGSSGKASAIALAERLGAPPWLPYAAVAATLYLLFLRKLPEILELTEERGTPED